MESLVPLPALQCDSSSAVSARGRNNNNNEKRMSSHRFQTNMSLCLTAFAILSLGLMSVHFNYYDTSYSNHSVADTATQQQQQQQQRFLANDDNNSNDYSDYSCHDLFTETPDAGEDQCHFARTCNGNEGVWLPFVFCRNTGKVSTMGWCGMLSPFVLLWMVVMFRLLGSTAEDYFSPSLEYFSLKAKLPPRFAGVTLLALGNGAADVSATVNAITSDKEHGYQMSLGALTGAAMFVGGVVSAVVVLVAGGVPCRGALVRDVLSLFVTVLVIWVHFASGSIGPEAISLFLTLYAVFVVVVLVADAYHRGVVLPRQDLQDQEVERQRQMQAADDVLAAGSGMAGAGNHMEVHMQQQRQQGGNSALGNVLSALSNYDNNMNMNMNDTTGASGAGGAAGSGWGVDADDLGQDRPAMLHGAAGIIRGNPHRSHIPPEGDVSGTPYSVLEDANDRICAESGPAGGSISYNWPSAWEEGKQELVDHANQVWDDIAYNGDLHPVEKFLLLCELPFTFLRKVTVPIPCDGYYCRGLVALSIAVSPLWLGFYLWMEHDLAILSLEGIFYMGIFAALTVGIASLVLRYAPAGEGNMALFAATPIALYGFIIGATWIDAIADHLVQMLDFIGILLRIPGPVIGLTVLAWGNSVADLSANVAMARKGLANMAMTACFAGPVFNILIGLGLGFSSLAAQEGTTEIKVAMDASVVTGFVFVMLNCALILGVGVFFGKGRIPREHGYLALVLYTLYVVISVSLQYINK